MRGEPLAPYAADEARSKGRRYDHPGSKYRGEYQRDGMTMRTVSARECGNGP